MGSHARVTVEHPAGTDLHLTAHYAKAKAQFGSPPGPWGPNPVETLLGALGSCTAMDVISLLRKKRQEVAAYEVEVIGERRAEHPRIFTRIEMVHRLRGRDLKPAAVEEAIRLSDTKYCTVHAMLEGVAEIVSRFEIESV